jgi:DDE family transposase
MFFKNIAIAYPVLLITSIRKGFEAFGRVVGKTGKTVARWLLEAQVYYDQITILLRYQFRNAKQLVLVVDDTLIKKIYSQLMEGSGLFYDTQARRRIIAYKLLAAMLTDGKQAIPFSSTFLFSKELLPNPKESKYDWIKKIIRMIQLLFPNVRIIVTADGGFSSKDFLRWCSENKIDVEVRMRSNCVAEYQGQRLAIRDIKTLKPKGRQTARTIAVLWHGIPLYITAELRIDKHGKKSVVYQASTFEAKPIEHVRIYKMRWPIEIFFRTAKQRLGLEECSSRKLETQESHVASVLLAYTLVQCDRKIRNFKNPEEAIRAAEQKKGQFLKRYIDRLNRFFDDAHA